MSKVVKFRLVIFATIAGMLIVYVGAAYLGLVDKVLGRERQVHLILPQSGGLYEDGEVDYRGVKIGRIGKAHVLPKGVMFDLTLTEPTPLPVNSQIFVHNLSAVGEQYVDFEPTSTRGPYAQEGHVFKAGPSALPESEQDLLVNLSQFVHSVNGPDLRTVVHELGTAFKGTGTPLRRMVNDGSYFIASAKANEPQTIQLFHSGETVLRTQAANSANIQSFARDLADVTGTLRTHDADLRTILRDGGSTSREVRSLLTSLRPTLPVFLGNATTVSRTVAERLVPLEQLLVTFPRIISSGFTGTPGDGYGYINMQMDNSVPPCTKGYKPPSQWRPGTDTSDGPVYPAQCNSGPPFNMRGNKHAPKYGSSASVGRSYRTTPSELSGVGATLGRGSRTPTNGTGTVTRMNARDGRPAATTHTVFGDHTWEWLLLGPRPTSPAQP